MAIQVRPKQFNCFYFQVFNSFVYFIISKIFGFLDIGICIETQVAAFNDSVILTLEKLLQHWF